MAEQTTTPKTDISNNGHKPTPEMDLRDVIEILLGFEDNTFVEQLVQVARSQETRWSTQAGPRVLQRRPILERVARIRHEDRELYEGVFIPGLRIDRRFDILRLEAELDHYTPHDLAAFPLPQSGTSLLQQQFEPLRYFVDELLTEGLTILGGKPKKGKSYLSLDMSLAMAVGRQAFQKFQTEKCKVLYVSMEDGPRRLQARLLKIQPNLTTPEGLDFLYEFPRLGEGALEAIQYYAKAYQVIVLDVLGRMLPRVQTVRKNMTEYQEFTEYLGPIQKFATAAHIGILLIDHVRKASADDIFDTIIGSQGKWGTADNGLVYERKGEEKDGVLHTSGRDVEEQKIVLTMLEGHLEFLGKGESFETDSEQNRIIKILGEEGRPMGLPEIMKAMGLGEQHYKRFRVLMHRLYNDDRVGRTKKRGLYTLYGHDRQSDWEDKDLETVPF